SVGQGGRGRSLGRIGAAARPGGSAPGLPPGPAGGGTRSGARRGTGRGSPTGERSRSAGSGDGRSGGPSGTGQVGKRRTVPEQFRTRSGQLLCSSSKTSGPPPDRIR